jgi:hypothetical protein
VPTTQNLNKIASIVRLLKSYNLRCLIKASNGLTLRGCYAVHGYRCLGLNANRAHSGHVITSNHCNQKMLCPTGAYLSGLFRLILQEKYLWHDRRNSQTARCIALQWTEMDVENVQPSCSPAAAPLGSKKDSDATSQWTRGRGHG